MNDASAQVEIQPVGFSAVLDAPNAADLIGAYTAECLVPDAEPQRQIYEAMERAGSLYCFAAYSDSRLIGFCSILCAVMPHDGHRVATTESLFVDPAYRNTGAGNLLLASARNKALDLSCTLIHYNARVGSRLDKVLSRKAGCRLSHNVYTEWLNGEPRAIEPVQTDLVEGL